MHLKEVGHMSTTIDVGIERRAKVKTITIYVALPLFTSEELASTYKRTLYFRNNGAYLHHENYTI